MPQDTKKTALTALLALGLGVTSASAATGTFVAEQFALIGARAFGDAAPATTAAWRNVQKAARLHAEGRYDEAATIFAQSLPIVAASPDTGITYAYAFHAGALWRLRRFSEVLPPLNEFLRRAKDAPDVPRLTIAQARSIKSLALQLLGDERGGLTNAATIYREFKDSDDPEIAHAVGETIQHFAQWVEGKITFEADPRNLPKLAAEIATLRGYIEDYKSTENPPSVFFAQAYLSASLLLAQTQRIDEALAALVELSERFGDTNDEETLEIVTCGQITADHLKARIAVENNETIAKTAVNTYNIPSFGSFTQINFHKTGDKVGGNDEGIMQQSLGALLKQWGVPEHLQDEVAAEVEQLAKARAKATLRPKWDERGKYAELKDLSSPAFLKRVYADEIAPDGSIQKETVRKTDPKLMSIVEAYVSAREGRGADMGDATGLRFVTSPAGRPKRASLG